jgi:hypothetical protein
MTQLNSFQTIALAVDYSNDLAEKYFALAKVETGATQSASLAGRAASGRRQHGV